MKVLRNGQQVEFFLNEEGDLVQIGQFFTQGGTVMQIRNYLLPFGDDDKIIVVAANLGLARQMVAMHTATLQEEKEAAEVRAQIEQEEAAALAEWDAAKPKRDAEDEAWAARGRMAAREQVAQQIAALPDATLSALRDSAHADRDNLVNLYIGADRAEKITETDLIIGVIEEEQAVRAGLASSEDILAAFS